MSTASPSRPMTTEEMLALPANGTVRELIRGELREKLMTKRNKWHSSTEVRIGRFLDEWADRQTPRGLVVDGEAGFRLARNPDTTVGIDVAYVSPEVLANTPDDFVYIEGAPVLAVEILSPSDTQSDIKEKLAIYRKAGVPVIWIVDTDLHTVLVIRPGQKPVLFGEGDELSGDPELPGLRISVSKIFLI
jgi:Uma2 family endonuclease